ncbi:hypothetical protein, partial [Streptomyces atratus]|uniref:hypothetical protein n=1 Tax=Streptomyces atratus TaxID=1893 RepID=UPI0036595D9E
MARAASVTTLPPSALRIFAVSHATSTTGAGGPRRVPERLHETCEPGAVDDQRLFAHHMEFDAVLGAVRVEEQRPDRLL